MIILSHKWEKNMNRSKIPYMLYLTNLYTVYYYAFLRKLCGDWHFSKSGQLLSSSSVLISCSYIWITYCITRVYVYSRMFVKRPWLAPSVRWYTCRNAADVLLHSPQEISQIPIYLFIVIIICSPLRINRHCLRTKCVFRKIKLDE